MRHALALAQQARDENEVPVGAVVVKGGAIIGRGYNRPIANRDPTAHAEIIAIRDAANHIGNYRLLDCDLYVTLEPCLMCAGAMVQARIARLVYAANDDKAGAIQSHLKALAQGFHNHSVQITAGVLADECGTMLSAFFREKRAAQ